MTNLPNPASPELSVFQRHPNLTRLGIGIVGSAASFGAYAGLSASHGSYDAQPVAPSITRGNSTTVPDIGTDPTTAVVHIPAVSRIPQPTEQSSEEPTIVITAPSTEAEPPTVGVTIATVALPAPTTRAKAPTTTRAPKPTRPKPTLPRPIISTTTTEPTETTVQSTTLDYDSITIPPEVTKRLAEDTIYIPNLGCTGALVRRDDGTPIGYVTAEHCSLRGVNTTRIVGSDGQTYIIESSLPVYTGDKLGELTKAGDTTELVVNPDDDTEKDMVFGVLSGSNAAEVLAQSQKTFLTPEQARALPNKTEAVLSGWPVYQENNQGALERQTFKGFVIGNEVVLTTLGENIEMVWVAIQDSEDGAKCSFGNSGGKGMVLIQQPDGSFKEMDLGALSAFVDFEGKTYGTPEEGESAREYYQQLFGFDLSKTASICGFSYIKPTDTVKVVSSPLEIPGYIDQQIAKAQADALDPGQEKAVIDGTVLLKNNDDGSVDAVANPVLRYVGDNTVAAILTWVDGQGKLQSKVYKDYFDIQFVDGSDPGLITEHIEFGQVQIIIDPKTGLMSFKALDGTYYGEFVHRAPVEEPPTTAPGTTEPTSSTSTEPESTAPSSTATSSTSSAPTTAPASTVPKSTTSTSTTTTAVPVTTSAPGSSQVHITTVAATSVPVVSSSELSSLPDGTTIAVTTGKSVASSTSSALTSTQA